ncbi:class I SAM-dependent DNA methyltransferase [Oleiagrimonas sp. C23AA]|uniref:class I SAM-dependent DNA methyltransferase n=1 Tax=Oleiagrimonas sp. C23AA TaxID=2719047 RepID=UPI001422BB85|nr:class I SAM-dependent DNA methyltransferase [Oleiagrimonas sp. C23AA]NII10667.1 class I SAM-dependent DNA methyltransferase [Oleiagrimonas sp. C23AA]
MNAVEIEEALSELAIQPFDPVEFPYSFLAALDNKEVTLKRLRKGDTNASDVPGGVLQRNKIHLAVCPKGEVPQTLQLLRNSPKTSQAKAKFILATDGVTLEAEDLTSGEPLASEFDKFAEHFGFFLPLAGISTVKEIKDNPIDVRATGRLNKLYVELLQNNKAWAKAERRHDMNHFMARLVFCFFAEDTDIFPGAGLFTRTISQMTEPDGSNTDEVLEIIFRAMNVKHGEREAAAIPSWAATFPYVNGGLFSGSTAVPLFTRTARSYLIRAGELDWKEINPDIFGSMIQAVADDEERGSLGMHYTSVPNILKVLNPLFLDDLRAQLEAAGDNKIKLLNLRKRMSRIRVFDPACGSGNFLVIAYKQMREIEWEINNRRGEPNLRSEIPLTNFRGIELHDFPAEIARLALIIAEFQCDVLYRGQKEALAAMLPLDAQNWITCGNALRLDWLSLCPPTGSGVKMAANDLFEKPLDQAEIDFENEGGETFICGNPPYLGSRDQKDAQKSDLSLILEKRIKNWKSLDYVSGWFMKAADYISCTKSTAAFVSTNSICQGLQVPILWPEILRSGCHIEFAHTSFRWSNLAKRNAGVTVVIVGLENNARNLKRLFSLDDEGNVIERQCSEINPYLSAGESVIVEKSSKVLCSQSDMTFGNTPIDGGHLLMSRGELDELNLSNEQQAKFVRRIYGSAEFIRGLERYCLWIEDKHLEEAQSIPSIANRIKNVRDLRVKGGKTARGISNRSHQFQRMFCGLKSTLIVPSVSSESREYLPCGYITNGSVVSNLAFALFDAPLWNMALIVSRLHMAWIAAVCGKLETRYRYSNTLGWNTFPVPTLTEQNKADLTRCAEDILMAREAHFPATIADLYDPDEMPQNLKRAHERNDEVLERIYIGRRFRNDTERLEKLFDLYTKMTAAKAMPKKGAKAK